MGMHSITWRRWHRRLVRRAVMLAPGTGFLLPAPRPIPVHHTSCMVGNATDLLIFLPGIDELPGDFLRHGFVQAAWRAGLAADVIEPDLHLGYYGRGIAVESLHDEVVRPARARGYRRIWLVGLSLGGFGALRYAEAHGEELDGVVLLAPALGPLGLPLREPAGSQLPGPAGQEVIWNWLPHRPAAPPLYLAFGEGDPFASTHRLLAELLPRGHVFSTAGGHDWATWSRLWTTLLSRVFTQPRHA